MKIIVCVKQVPATTEVETDPETGTLKRQGLASIINPFDLYAIEEAVRIKEKTGAEVTALSMGPPQSAHALKDAIALGCDRAVLLSDRAFAGADTLATAYTLAKGINHVGGADLVICGVKTVDGDTAQVGPMISEELEVPFIGNVRKLTLKGKSAVMESVTDDGFVTLSSKTPVVLTVVKEINTPRLPDLESKLSSKKAEVKVFSSADIGADPCMIGLSGSPTNVLKVFTPDKRVAGELVRASPKEAAKALFDRIQELKVVDDG